VGWRGGHCFVSQFWAAWYKGGGGKSQSVNARKPSGRSGSKRKRNKEQRAEHVGHGERNSHDDVCPLVVSFLYMLTGGHGGFLPAADKDSKKWSILTAVLGRSGGQ
jgi:hypothetical protein